MANENIIGLLNYNRQSLDNMEGISALTMKASNVLAITVAANPILDSAYVYCDKSDSFIVQTHFALRENFYDATCIDCYNETGDNCEWYDIGERNNYDIIRVARTVYIYTKTGEEYKAGVAVFNLRYDYLDELLQSEPYIENGLYAIISYEENILYSNDKSLLNTNAEDNEQLQGLAELTFECDGVGYSRLSSDTLTLSYLTDNYIIISLLPINSQSNTKGSLYNLFLISTILSLILTILLAVTNSYKMYSYILNLIMIFQSPEGRSNKLDRQTNTEMNLIRYNILSILARNKSLESEFADRLVELRKAQTIALQAQINPHFLLNTLQIIYYSIVEETNRNSKSSRIVRLFSDMLRNNINTRNYLINLKNELNQAKKFLEIYTIRNGNTISVNWDINAEAENKLVARFILQPILENCITHGLSNCEKNDKHIDISAKVSEDTLTITVKDNGIGMNAEVLKLLQKKLNSGILPENENIGLCNVNLRIKLLFGDRYGLLVEAIAGECTVVTVRMPIITSHNLA